MADSRLDVLNELTRRIFRKKMVIPEGLSNHEYAAFVKGFCQRNDEIVEIANQMLQEIEQDG